MLCKREGAGRISPGTAWAWASETQSKKNSKVSEARNYYNCPLTSLPAQYRTSSWIPKACPDICRQSYFKRTERWRSLLLCRQRCVVVKWSYWFATNNKAYFNIATCYSYQIMSSCVPHSWNEHTIQEGTDQWIPQIPTYLRSGISCKWGWVAYDYALKYSVSCRKLRPTLHISW